MRKNPWIFTWTIEKNIFSKQKRKRKLKNSDFDIRNVIKFGYKPFKDLGRWVYMKGTMNWIEYVSREGTYVRKMKVRVWKDEFLTFSLISSNWAANKNVLRTRVFLYSNLYTLGWTGLQFYMGWTIVIVVSLYKGKRAETNFVGPVIATWIHPIQTIWTH